MRQTTTIPAGRWLNPSPPAPVETWALVIPPVLIVGMLLWASLRAAAPDLPSAAEVALGAAPPEAEQPQQLSPLDLWAL